MSLRAGAWALLVACAASACGVLPIRPSRDPAPAGASIGVAFDAALVDVSLGPVPGPPILAQYTARTLNELVDARPGASFARTSVAFSPSLCDGETPCTVVVTSALPDGAVVRTGPIESSPSAAPFVDDERRGLAACTSAALLGAVLCPPVAPVAVVGVAGAAGVSMARHATASYRAAERAASDFYLRVLERHAADVRAARTSVDASSVDDAALLPHRLERHDGRALREVERADPRTLGEREDARGVGEPDLVGDAALLGSQHDDVAAGERHVPRRVTPAHLDDPGLPPQQREAPLQRPMEVDARVGPVVQTAAPHRAIPGLEVARAADMQGGPRRRAEAHDGPDVAGDVRPIEDQVDDRLVHARA